MPPSRTNWKNPGIYEPQNAVSQNQQGVFAPLLLVPPCFLYAATFSDLERCPVVS